MAKKLPDLRRRQKALQRTIDKFGAAPFDLGKADCIQMIRFHLRAMGVRKLPAPHAYSTGVGAVHSLKVLGFDTLEQLFDSFLERIPPAAMLPGDIATLPSEPGEPGAEVGTVAISMGRKLMGWHPDHLLPVKFEVSQINAAWRA